MSQKGDLYKRFKKMVEEDIQRRQIACKVKIDKINKGKYVQEEGWNPNYIETVAGEKISRVNLVGVVVGVDSGEGFNSIIIDDGSGSISVRDFESKLSNINVGDSILIIGRPREYGSERYVASEIVKKVDNKWLRVRNLELKNSVVTEKKAPIEETIVKEESVLDEMPISEKIIDYIRKNDQGEGIDFEEVVSKFNDESSIKSLLNEGELFELKPGRLKVLE